MLDRLKQYANYLQKEIETQHTLAGKYSDPTKSVRAQGKVEALEEAVKILFNKIPEIKP